MSDNLLTCIDGWALGQSVRTGHQGALPLVCLGKHEDAGSNSRKSGSVGKRISSQMLMNGDRKGSSSGYDSYI